MSLAPRPAARRESGLAQLLPRRRAVTAPQPSSSSSLSAARLDVWQVLVATLREAEELIDGATGAAAAHDLDEDTRAILGSAALEALHAQARAILARLTARLSHRLTPAEIKEILFILAIVCDEKIQRRLAPADETSWPLLQRALFDVHDGGDLFYELIDDRLQRIDAAPLALELCYYCLADGFVGRHNRGRSKIETYKRALAARINGTVPVAREEKTTAWQLPDARKPWRPYLVTLGLVLAWPLALLWLW